MLTLDKVFNAQTVLKNIIRETNVVRAYGIANDCELYLKPENLQITGSFKVKLTFGSDSVRPDHICFTDDAFKHSLCVEYFVES